MSEAVFWGRHEVRIDGPVVSVRFMGSVSHEEWLKLRDAMAAVVAEHGRVYMLAFVSQATAIVPEARREFAAWAKTQPLLGVANVQSNLAARVLGGLLANAMKLLGAVHFSSTFVDDEAAARRWISEIDRKRFPNSPSQPSVRPSAS